MMFDINTRTYKEIKETFQQVRYVSHKMRILTTGDCAFLIQVRLLIMNFGLI